MTTPLPSPLISADDLTQYQQQGYVLVKALIPQAECKAVRQRLNDLIEGEPGWPEIHFQRLDPTYYARPDGSGIPVGVQSPATVDTAFHTVANHPSLIAAMTTLLGGEVVRFTDQALIKLGRITQEQAGRSYYHQDSRYWKLPPDQGCNCWIALDHVGLDAICLGIIPGSHTSGQVIPHESYFDEPSLHNRLGEPFKRHRVPHDQIDMTHEVVIPMQPGDALFFTNYTLHRSEPNRTGKDLAAYAVAYQLKK